MEKSTIPSGFTAAHNHSGLLGQSPTSWPMVAACRSPQCTGASIARPARDHHAGRGQCTRRRADFYGVVTGYRWQGLHLNHHHGSSY
jgi:hypothetical protein